MTIVLPLELKAQTVPGVLSWLVFTTHVFHESCFTIWTDPDRTKVPTSDRTRAATAGSVGEKTTNDESSNDQVAAPVAVSQSWTFLDFPVQSIIIVPAKIVPSDEKEKEPE